MSLEENSLTAVVKTANEINIRVHIKQHELSDRYFLYIAATAVGAAK